MIWKNFSEYKKNEDLRRKSLQDECQEAHSCIATQSEQNLFMTQNFDSATATLKGNQSHKVESVNKKRVLQR